MYVYIQIHILRENKILLTLKKSRNYFQKFGLLCVGHNEIFEKIQTSGKM